MKKTSKIFLLTLTKMADSDPYELRKHSGLLVKKPKLYTGKDVLHKTEKRVADKHWFDKEVNPIADLALEREKKRDKLPLPPPHVFLSMVNMKMRKLMVSEMKKGKKLSETRIREILKELLRRIADTIYDDYTVKPATFKNFLDTACSFYHKHPLRKES